MKYFYKSPSLENIFIEAIHNSIDADASKIDVEIAIDALDKSKTLVIKITDNGVGFSDERYKKFCKLMTVEGDDIHRGVGRLVYLCHFDKISISSKYGSKQRTFTYDTDFDEHNSDMNESILNETGYGTTITFQNCTLEKLNSYSTIFPEHIRTMLLNKFYPVLYLLKQRNKDIDINIKLDVKTVKKGQQIGKRETHISVSDIPTLLIEPVDLAMLDMFTKSEVHYSIKKQEVITDPLLITALCVDNRTYDLSDVISIENLQGYNSVFLLNSTAFIGQTDPSREILALTETQKRIVVKKFREKISEIIQREIPHIKKKKEQSKESLNKTYPHLIGYFEEDEIGVIARSKSIEDAQGKFLRDQKEILEASNLDTKQYDKALELSSRSLSEYVLFREKIINRLETITKEDSEEVLHNIILPKGTVLKDNTDLSYIYQNNLWLLDEKYMTYNTAMSNKSMKDIVEEITQNISNEKDTKTPDVAIIFSDNIDDKENENKKVDVIIIELKKRGIKIERTEEVINQLKRRATNLMKYYPNKIQRIWFYGIVEFNDDFKLSLKNSGYRPLYSKDSLYYNEEKIYLNVEDEDFYLTNVYILSIDAFIKDAKARNATFLQILKDGFQKIKQD
ncbi:MAG: ATP-binding protein [Prevotellaceae bacterium]|jgi:hypothetical protein|nr:ATP-binding protein [Prevotellaceae bacterium]